MERIKTYIANLQAAIDALEIEKIKRVIDKIWEAYEADKQIFVIGNGGSAATASHFACDLGKGTIVPSRRRLRIMSLTDNVAVMTAWANDLSYDDIFVEQLKNLLNQDDLVIGISASGNSRNVLKAIEYANSMNCTTIGLTGFGGGKLAQIADESIIVDSYDYGPVEDIHLILDHIIRAWIYEELNRITNYELRITN
jgi:D-sedoheptulose 7-phosphate isomerase